MGGAGQARMSAVTDVVEALAAIVVPALASADADDAGWGYLNELAAVADPATDNPLGFATVWLDWTAEIPATEMPALMIVPLALDESRMAGGQGAGDKVLHLDIAVNVYDVSDVAEIIPDSIAHREKVEAIMAAFREASFVSLACDEWAGAMRVDRSQPVRTTEGIVFSSQITIHRMGLYLDG